MANMISDSDDGPVHGNFTDTERMNLFYPVRIRRNETINFDLDDEFRIAICNNTLGHDSSDAQAGFPNDVLIFNCRYSKYHSSNKMSIILKTSIKNVTTFCYNYMQDESLLMIIRLLAFWLCIVGVFQSQATNSRRL